MPIIKALTPILLLFKTFDMGSLLYDSFSSIALAKFAFFVLSSSSNRRVLCFFSIASLTTLFHAANDVCLISSHVVCISYSDNSKLTCFAQKQFCSFWFCNVIFIQLSSDRFKIDYSLRCKQGARY